MLYIALAVGALVAGIITSIAGGGGVLIVTFLMMLNIPIKTIIATNRVSAVLDNGTSSYNYFKNDKVNVEFLKYSIGPMFVGTLIGIQLLRIVNGEIMERMIPIVLVLLVTYTLLNKKMGISNEFKGFDMKNIVFGMIFTFFIGIYFGFFGVAAGNILAFGFVYIYKFDFLEAVATAKPLLFFAGIISVIIYAFYGLIDYKMAFFIAVFRIFGSRLGSTYASKKGAKFVKPVFLSLCIFTVFKEIFL